MGIFEGISVSFPSLWCARSADGAYKWREIEHRLHMYASIARDWELLTEHPKSAQEDTKAIHIVIEIPVPDEDTDGDFKEMEVDVAGVLSAIPGVVLFHDKECTGGKQGSYVGNDRQMHRVQPDIFGSYNGQLFVVDTKLKERSYVDQNDVDKLHRDAKVLGAKPVMVHSGGKISQGKINDVESGGSYIPVKYQKSGWEAQVRDGFLASFSKGTMM